MYRSASVVLAVLCLGLVSCTTPAGESRTAAESGGDAVAPAPDTPAKVGAGRASCGTTPPPRPAFVPPTPYPATPSEFGAGHVWYGGNELWTRLDTDGTWEMAQDENGLFDKSFWWRAGYDARREPNPKLILTASQVHGSNLEIPASDVVATHGWTENDSSAEFILTGIRLPVAGCWRITGHYGVNILSFVVWATGG
jgi:hypothetical protein